MQEQETGRTEEQKTRSKTSSSSLLLYRSSALLLSAISASIAMCRCLGFDAGERGGGVGEVARDTRSELESDQTQDNERRDKKPE